jgi:hypothetical protein
MVEGEQQTISLHLKNNDGEAKPVCLDVSLSSGLDVVNAASTGGSIARHNPGSTITQRTDRSGGSLVSTYLLYTLQTSLLPGAETTLTLTVKATASGQQWIKYRAALNPEGTTPSNYDPDSYVRVPTSGSTDQQGWYVHQISISVQTPVELTTWNAQWYTMSNVGAFGTPVGTSLFPPTFDNNWGYGIVFGGYSDKIGFKATAVVNMKRQQGGPVQFTVGSDDGIALYLDNVKVIDGFSPHAYRTIGKTVDLTYGQHALRIEFYEWTEVAHVSFSVSF